MTIRSSHCWCVLHYLLVVCFKFIVLSTCARNNQDLNKMHSFIFFNFCFKEVNFCIGVGLHKNKAINWRYYSEIVLNLLFFLILVFTTLNHIKINLGEKVKSSVNKDFHLKVIYEFHNFHMIGGNLQLVVRTIKLDLCLTFFSLQWTCLQVKFYGVEVWGQ